MKSLLFGVAAVLLMVGCGKKDETRSGAVPSPPLQQQDSRTSATPAPPPPPAPNVGKGAEALQPGQAGDHSSPAFKGGGLPDKK